MKPKIYVFINGNFGGDVAGVAVAEDKELLASHVSSDVYWARRDIITTGWKEEYYEAKYPDGYEIVDLLNLSPKELDQHPFIQSLKKENAHPST